MVLGTMVIMFMCAGIVVMSASSNAEGVTVVYGTRASDLVMFSLSFLIQSGLAGVMSSVHVSFSQLCPGSYSGHVILLHIQSMQYAGGWELQCGYFEYEQFRRCGSVEALGVLGNFGIGLAGRLFFGLCSHSRSCVDRSFPRPLAFSVMLCVGL